MTLQTVKKIALGASACLFLYAVGGGLVYALFSDELPDIDTLETFQPKRVTRVWSADGQHLLDFKEENRELIRDFDEIPQAMKDALISIEDRRFFSHWGVDLRRIFGAIRENLRRLDPTRQGASTLTQQLARNLYQKVGRQSSSASLELVRSSYARKIREAITAVHIERLYTKREILVMYLNTVFFGHDAFGLRSAARLYFDKEIGDLTIEECALIAGLLKAPNKYSPLVNPNEARTRRNVVLVEMVRAGKLGRAYARRLGAEPVRVHRGQRAETYGLAPYFVEYVRRQLDDRYGKSLYQDGYTVRTTVHSRMQQIAERLFSEQLDAVQVKVDAHVAKLDSTQLPASVSTLVQGAFVAMDPKSGEILVMIGGRRGDKYNRAYQAKRQAGSSFKPFVYTVALDNGRFPIDVLDDNAITITERDGSVWTPENYDRKFKGRMTLREGFMQSRNIIALKLAKEVTAGRISQYAHAMGLSTRMKEVPSIGIGSSEVILLEMVAAYAVFPNRGILVEPTAVRSVEDADGNIIERSASRRTEVLRPAVAVLMTDMLRSVMDPKGLGTGRGARTRYGFRSPAGGKTGTTNDYIDAWFIGFTPDLVAGVWIGVDDQRVSLANQAGSAAALPLWARFMREVYQTVEPYKNRRAIDFEYPEELVEYRAVCDDTHTLATRYCPNQSQDLFIRGGVIPDTCPLHGSASSRRRRM
ncbi:MAG: PBP1A family penicillin-binding protein [Candidatus Latescibacterota bacterium]|nr:PBP1A family penicillin-binding protein [Candidatus Latescibacterota bacterium]